MEDGKRGMAEYVDDGKVKEKVYQITPAVEYKNGKLMGIAKIKLTESLEFDELKELKDYCIGQFADGCGEGFEQREISTGNGIYMYIFGLTLMIILLRMWMKWMRWQKLKKCLV